MVNLKEKREEKIRELKERLEDYKGNMDLLKRKIREARKESWSTIKCKFSKKELYQLIELLLKFSDEKEYITDLERSEALVFIEILRKKLNYSRGNSGKVRKGLSLKDKF